MSKKQNFIDTVLIEVSKALIPLRHLDSHTDITKFINKLGFEFPGTQQVNVDLGSLITTIEELISALNNFVTADSESEQLSTFLELAEQIQDVVATIRQEAPNLENAIKAIPNYKGETSNLADILPNRFLDFLLYRYLEKFYPKLFSTLYLLGLFDKETDMFGASFWVVRWAQIVKWLSDPRVALDKTYQWNNCFNGNKLLKKVDSFLKLFGLPGDIYDQADNIAQGFGNKTWGGQEIRVPVLKSSVWPDTYVEATLILSPVPADPSQNMKAGIGLYPYIHGSLDINNYVGDNWIFRLKGNAELSNGVGLVLQPPLAIKIVKGLFGAPGETEEFHLEATLRKSNTADELIILFGKSGESLLGLRELGINGLVSLRDGSSELGIELEIQDLTIAISSGQADGFLQKLLSGINLETTCDLVLGLSNLDGVYFGGSGGLEITIPVHENLGPLKIEDVVIGLGVDEGFQLTLATSFGAELGPISASVQEIGLHIPITFPPNNDGNLGPIQVEAPKFKPPIGAGLALNAGGIVGGGFLEIDDPNKRYAGILALKFGEIGLTAIGLITTRMPDGSDGFSLLVNIGVTFNPGIQLSFGFTLSGVGGLIGINRTMEIDVLRVGIKNRTLDSILFPDPDTVIANAQKIISDLRSVFPPDEGRFVVGPMIKIGWGTPTIITADIGIFLELPDPVRIVFMGQLELVLPEKRAAIVTIHLDILGVLDFEKGELSFQASLYDSRVLLLSIYGDAAFIIAWKHDPRFALSLGGFHPKFLIPPPPTIFADMKRLTICISSGSNLQLSCKAYQALTPNSLQFGARVDLYASAGGAEIKGYLGFDTLFYFSPFSFEVWMGAGVEISYEGVDLLSIELSFLLAGPTPWLARGKAKIKILFISVTVKFCITWGEEKKATLPAVDPWERLQEILALPESWGTVLPARRSMVESLRVEETPEENGPETIPIVMHSAGQFRITQRDVPLDMSLDMISNAPIKGHDYFTIDSLSINEEELDLMPATEFFARGQFEDVGSRKVSLPAFEKLIAGRMTAASEVISKHGQYQSEILVYESILLKPDRTITTPVKGHIEWDDVSRLLGARAKRQALNRTGPDKRYSKIGGRAKVLMREESYCIVNEHDLSRADVTLQYNQANQGMTRAVADRMLKDYDNRHPESLGDYMVIPEYEVEA